MKRTLFGIGGFDASVASAAMAIIFTTGGCGGGGDGDKKTGIESIDNAPAGSIERIKAEGPPLVTDGLIAYFPLDDATGAVNAPAAETVSNMAAVYTGGMSGPVRSDPGPVNFTNAASVHFAGSDGQGLRVVGAPESMRSPQVSENVSISLWLRTTATTASDMDLVSMGDNYGMRASGSIVMFVRGNGTWQSCQGTAFVKDNLWHHAAAVKEGPNIRIYTDGVLTTPETGSGCTNVPPVDFDQSNDLWIGEHGNGQLFPYEGDLDDIRIYNRALTPAEVTKLAGGA